MAVGDEHTLMYHWLLLKPDEVDLPVAWRWLYDEAILILVLLLTNSDHVSRLLKPLNRAFLIDAWIALVLR